LTLLKHCSFSLSYFVISLLLIWIWYIELVLIFFDRLFNYFIVFCCTVIVEFSKVWKCICFILSTTMLLIIIVWFSWFVLLFGCFLLWFYFLFILLIFYLITFACLYINFFVLLILSLLFYFNWFFQYWFFCLIRDSYSFCNDCSCNIGCL
jgi:hypothetical protein